MKLLHSRALLAVSRNLGSGKGSRYIDAHSYASLLPRHPLQQLPHRSLTTKPPLNPTTATPSPTTTTTTNQQDVQSSLSTQIRLLMRRIPYPVAIITSTDPNPFPPPTHPSPTDQTSQFASRFRGMTVSSFNTVTLTPHPVISFNVRRPSETLHALISSGRFLVHLLATDLATASLARDFARGNQNLALEEGMFEFVGVAPSSVSDSETGTEALGTKESPTIPPLPMLRRKGREATLSTYAPETGSSRLESTFFPFIFECRLLPESVVEVYDHTIVVGKIVRAITSLKTTSDSAEIPSEDLCLTYANTKFWEMGKEVV
ncbi:flavin reductase family protein [Aspergillus foveolatus]|uniref:flavin reductase family protein n=1 Tax=Aspergillus foveolatus TaxID=210207 RepID=UPI003CCE3155